ncbi:WXG100 family type VII secretion target [Kitasatospora sp. LaBMicrA B282]|uniref:WXG100 family type VII secretion target n=1 Tax=Kitasatospora sp. LaBMicrA B282 TaxID=3420949 RepID=UPI003D0F62BA
MVDLDFERKVNPWLFDSSGNLTEQAKKQFPDLAGDTSPVTIGSTATGGTGGGSGGGGTTVTVSTGALNTAGQNATTLRGTLHTECDKPWTNVGTAVGALQGWQSSMALYNAWATWESQVQALAARLDAVAQNLHTTAQNYDTTEGANRGRFGGQG